MKNMVLQELIVKGFDLIRGIKEGIDLSPGSVKREAVV